MKLKKSVLLFDVNETLIDFSPLDAVFQSLFGIPSVRALWFKSTLHASLVLNETEHYKTFSEISESALLAISRSLDKKISSKSLKQFQDELKRLPLHDDVVAALEFLRNEGFRMAALSNSSAPGIKTQFERNKVTSFFSDILSTDTPEIFKPSRRSYVYAAKALNVKIKSLVMVAAHSWDTSGAMQAGAKAALVKRSGLIYDSVIIEPDIQASNLLTLAKKIAKTFN